MTLTAKGNTYKVIESVFATEVGGVSDIIDGGGFLAISVVHDSKPGVAEAFDDPGVEEATKSGFERHRRTKWEKAYLERLQERIEEEDAVKPAE